MDLETIQKFITAGYTLRVSCRHLSLHERRYHASVDLGTVSTSHNFMGNYMKEAMEGLETYLRSTNSFSDSASTDEKKS